MQYLLLFLSAMLGGIMNSVAGGGSFFTFPVLLFTGMNPIVANATSTMALWPGMVASVFAYRREIAANRPRLPLLLSTSVIGSVIGALLLLVTPERTFSGLVPYLLLVATLLFALSPLISRRLAGRQGQGAQAGPALTVCVQLIIGIYGGYFGGGMGIMVLALLAFLGLTRIHEMNALKAVLTTSINFVAIVIFVIAGIIAWKQALLMLTGAVIGGYCGAHYSQRVAPKIVRGFVIATGCLLTAYFFAKG